MVLELGDQSYQIDVKIAKYLNHDGYQDGRYGINCALRKGELEQDAFEDEYQNYD